MTFPAVVNSPFHPLEKFPLYINHKVMEELFGNHQKTPITNHANQKSP
jgi:hypothetical protein